MLITGTFLDEISHDIPHQNWGPAEWEQDFVYMKKAGIDTVILIRSGYRDFLTYPSAYLLSTQNCFKPPIDLVELFCSLADKYGMHFYFGLYDREWDNLLIRTIDPEVKRNKFRGKDPQKFDMYEAKYKEFEALQNSFGN